jgi:hypothetical protein
VHPLQKKYGGSDPANWDDAKQAEARDELFKAISADKAGKAGGNLNRTERTSLLRIWLDIRRAQTNAKAALLTEIEADAAPGSKEKEPAKTPDQKRKRFNFKFPRPQFTNTRYVWELTRKLSVPDFIFLSVLIAVTVSVTMLGMHSVDEVQRMERVKTEAERVVAWLKEAAEKRSEAEFKPAACRKQDGGNWNDCTNAFMEANGPLHQRVNPFLQGYPLMRRKCDADNWQTIGSIIIEKGALQPSGSYSYTPFDGTEPMSKDMTLRVFVCGRGFHRIKVANEIVL